MQVTSGRAAVLHFKFRVWSEVRASRGEIMNSGMPCIMVAATWQIRDLLLPVGRMTSILTTVAVCLS